jgi:hypothetical protein
MRVEEGGHRLGKVPQCLLLHCLGASGQPRMLVADHRELPTLLHVAWSTPTARMPVQVLLDREVPHVPGVRAVVPQHGFLGGPGKEAIPVHANILSITADVSGEVKRRLLSGMKTGISASRSQ